MASSQISQCSLITAAVEINKNQDCNMNTDRTEEPLEGRENPGVWQKLRDILTSFPRAVLPTWNQVRSAIRFISTPLLFRSSGELGRMEDLEEAIPRDRQIPDSHIPPDSGHSDESKELSDAVVARVIQARGSHANQTDIEVAYYTELLVRCPSTDPNRSNLLRCLAHVTRKRFEQSGKIEDLEEMITCYRESLDLCPTGHPDRSNVLGGLANSIWTRYNHTNQAEDLENAIAYYREVLHLQPTGHPYRSESLSNLANSTLKRYNHTGQVDDLEDAITCHREALDLRPNGHPHRSASLISLATSITIRYEHAGQAEDLEDAITYEREALDLRPAGHPDRSGSLNNLAKSVLTRYKHTGQAYDLEDAIAYHREALDLRPTGHPDRSASLINLASSILTRYEHTGQAGDLEDAIAYNCEALDLYPTGNPYRSGSLNNLANSIWTRYKHTGQAGDLENAIAYHREALDLRPTGHSDRSCSLTNLAGSILTRYEYTGQAGDLEDAIAYSREALDLCPTSHPGRSGSLHNLANCILTRYEYTGQAGDLEDAIVYHREALDLCPTDNPDRSSFLGSLASSIWTRYKLMGQVEDLRSAIAYGREALDLRPTGHPDRSNALNSLANFILTRHGHTGQADDLEVAIAYYREALDLRPAGHPDLSTSLGNLASSTLVRYIRMGKMEDLDNAARLLSYAKTSLSTNHPNHSKIWSQLAMVSLERHRIDPSDDHLSNAFAQYERSVNYQTASVRNRFYTALKWASAAQFYKHESTLYAYSTSLTLLDRYVVSATTVERKFLISITTKSLALDAASSAIEAGKPETAIEFLDRGRTIILSAMRRHRHPLSELREVDPGLAREFETLSTQLERIAMTSESDRPTERPQVASDVQQQRQRILSEKWGEVVDRIRRVKGFAHFLQAIPFATLRTAAAEGPAIVVNISQYRSDAIIIRDAEPPVIVPLPKASPDNLARLSSKFSDPRASSKASFSKDLYPILRRLWDIIVGPVINQLTALGVVKNTRIWWCPTSHLCALPLHAAGPYKPGEKPLPDLYVSSYTATLSALIAARSGIVPRTTAPNILAIGDTGQPDSFLPSVKEELNRIATLGDFVNVLFGEAASRNNIISGLQQHSWAHFSCHGNRDPQPFESSFQIYNGERLRLLDLVKARLPDAELAFLSACHTAAADVQKAPDEFIHLAGALQFCGFRSVVGTMWAMADIDGPDVAGDFYQYMFRKPGDVVDFRDSAKALNVTTRAMRRRKDMTLGRWVNFIHIGA